MPKIHSLATPQAHRLPASPCQLLQGRPGRPGSGTSLPSGPRHAGRRRALASNTAEGAGRVTRADKARAFAIARGEACEAAACVEIAVASGEADACALDAVTACADRFVAMTTRLIR